MTLAAPPETPAIRTEVQVMFFDTDCGGVVHNIAYLRFIEIARTVLAEQLGLGLADMARNQCYPVVVRTEIDYRRPAALGDRLAIDGWLDQHVDVDRWLDAQPDDKIGVAVPLPAGAGVRVNRNRSREALTRA